MRVVRYGEGAGAAEVRAAAGAPAGPAAEEVEASVREILAEVRTGGDAAVAAIGARLDGVEVGPARLAVPPAEVEAAAAAAGPETLAALERAIANVRAVAEAQAAATGETAIELEDGQRVEVAELAVRRAGAYVPGGRAPYPSTLVMCAVAARAAGVEELAVCTPPGPDGAPHPLVLAACALCGVDEVYRAGGAQAVAALAYGTETLPAVDVIAGPGNRYVQEAKRQLCGLVGIDSLAGPSELAVVATAGADPELLALDLLAQAEHGPEGLLCLISPDAELRDAVAAALERLAPERPSVPAEAAVAIVDARNAQTAVELAGALAPEHLQLAGAEAEALAGEVRAAGCVFVGVQAGTAFGDYVAGSNHVLPTGGAARYASALSPATFRRRMARVTLPGEAAAKLAPAGATLARAEGFPVHAESMERRARGDRAGAGAAAEKEDER